MADETRYMCMLYEVKPIKAPEKKGVFLDPLADD